VTTIPGIEAISIASPTFMEAPKPYANSRGFRQVLARYSYVPGKHVLLWVFRLAFAG